MTAASAIRFPPNRSPATSSIRTIALIYCRGHPHCKVNKIPLACGQTRFWHSVYITAQRFGPVHLASARRRGGTEWWSVVGDEPTDLVGLNLFGGLMLPVLGRIVTGAMVGGGS
jgi:hypothetical protein